MHVRNFWAWNTLRKLKCWHSDLSKVAWNFQRFFKNKYRLNPRILRVITANVASMHIFEEWAIKIWRNAWSNNFLHQLKLGGFVSVPCQIVSDYIPASLRIKRSLETNGRKLKQRLFRFNSLFTNEFTIKHYTSYNKFKSW